MDGSNKMKPSVIRNRNDLVALRATKTSKLLMQWIRAFNIKMEAHNRKTALFTDHCPMHYCVELQNTELIFLLANITSVLQHMDQGVILSLKRNFRRMLGNAIIK
jgi:hypothetical protein